jgi:hypothetical protein
MLQQDPDVLCATGTAGVICQGDAILYNRINSCTDQGDEMTYQSADCSRCVAAFSVYMPIGWFRNACGMELPLYLMSICLAILIRGGGLLSLDRLLLREI